MKLRTFLGGFALGSASMLFAASTLGPQDPPTNLEDVQKQMEKMFEEAMSKYGVPTDEHDLLAKRVGKWKYMVEMPNMPSSPGEANYNMEMGGRYLIGKYTGDFEGQVFEGLGITGYDRFQNKYVSIWLDSMSTAVFSTKGTAEGSTISYRGNMPDMFTGESKKTKSVERIIDEDNWEMVMFEANTEGKMEETMKITYERIK